MKKVLALLAFLVVSAIVVGYTESRAARKEVKQEQTHVAQGVTCEAAQEIVAPDNDVGIRSSEVAIIVYSEMIAMHPEPENQPARSNAFESCKIKGSPRKGAVYWQSTSKEA